MCIGLGINLVAATFGVSDILDLHCFRKLLTEPFL